MRLGAARETPAKATIVLMVRRGFAAKAQLSGN
jgi:hypothetical protein